MVFGLGSGLVGQEASAFHSKINGVNLVASPQPIRIEDLRTVLQVQAEWVAIVPFAFSRPGKPQVIYHVNGQWWGETPEGIRATARMAHQLGLKVLLKPHVWVVHEGWPGDFTLKSEADWQEWEKQYSQYILRMARLAREEGIEMLSIGTEFRQAVRQRPQFWKRLIKAVRQVYTGALTYTANWDNYQNVRFWADLDYIGLSGYFPLVKKATPEVEELVQAWQQGPVPRLEALSRRYHKPILFTEFGYRSEDYSAWRHWEGGRGPVNLQAQANAYEAFFRVFWSRPWVAGGFLWKWFTHPRRGGRGHNGFTPQNKPAMQVIRRWYGSQQAGE
ncbi:MAG: hypothetical protein D6715_14740 [Calditrichaeota bacterium]|nr:MAG: hypothetical protein D6715_14740 [Calditrichota bacterium]